MIFRITDTGFHYEGHVVNELHYNHMDQHCRVYRAMSAGMRRALGSRNSVAAVRLAYELWGYGIDPATDPVFVGLLFGGPHVLVCPD